MQRFRGGLVFKAHRLLYHSTLGLRVMMKKKKKQCRGFISMRTCSRGCTIVVAGCAEGRASLGPDCLIRSDFFLVARRGIPEVLDAMYMYCRGCTCICTYTLFTRIIRVHTCTRIVTGAVRSARLCGETRLLPCSPRHTLVD